MYKINQSTVSTLFEYITKEKNDYVNDMYPDMYPSILYPNIVIYILINSFQSKQHLIKILEILLIFYKKINKFTVC